MRVVNFWLLYGKFKDCCWIVLSGCFNRIKIIKDCFFIFFDRKRENKLLVGFYKFIISLYVYLSGRLVMSGEIKVNVCGGRVGRMWSES